jgi:hypothetical protein
VTAPARAWRVFGLALAAATLACGIGGGLARLGLAPAFAAAAPDHAALMIGGFLATVISLERAVALGTRWPLAAPLASACGAIAIATGHAATGAALWLLAAAVFVAASIAIARRQLLVHTALLAVASLAWAAGTAIFVLASPQQAIAPWFAFLVLTIAAERLEMTRLMNRGPASRWLLLAAVAVLLAGAFASQLAFGAGLVAVAVWLAAFDIARRTLFTAGFARYSATALIAGYAWLAAGGAAWMLAHAGYPVSRDFALHAVGLGFVFSMIMAHGPVIIPAVARVRVRFTPFFYLPLAALHGSLAVRLVAGHADFELRRAGGMLNALAIALFAAILLFSIKRPQDLSHEHDSHRDRLARDGRAGLRLQPPLH